MFFFQEIGMDKEVSPYNEKYVKRIKSQEGLPYEIIKTADLWK
jgi:hypothetical protein